MLFRRFVQFQCFRLLSAHNQYIFYFQNIFAIFLNLCNNRINSFVYGVNFNFQGILMLGSGNRFILYHLFKGELT